jgi:K+-sensing histidine kinase KdpD
MNEKELGRIFDIYYRGGQKDEEGQGIGLT